MKPHPISLPLSARRLPADPPRLRVSVCICTMDRPAELERALQSVPGSSIPPVQIVVSDDSAGDETERLVAEHPMPITYLRGPRTGLGANRNCAAEAAEGDYLLFLDDDGAMGERFLEEITIAASADGFDPGMTIFTGVDIENGEVIEPNAQDVFGFQSRPYRPGEALQTVVINAALLPRALFDLLEFDTRLTYGYDEVDFTSQALAAGARIVPCFSAVNYHYPSPIGRPRRLDLSGGSRLYVTLKRRRWTEGSRTRGWLGFCLGVLHLYLSSVRRDGLRGLRTASVSVFQAGSYYRKFLAARGSK